MSETTDRIYDNLRGEPISVLAARMTHAIMDLKHIAIFAPEKVQDALLDVAHNLEGTQR